MGRGRSVLHRGRLGVRRLGLDVSRFPGTNPAADRRSKLLAGHAIDVVVDGGGASGAYGLDLRRHGYAGRILSVEPLGSSFEALRRVAARDPRWDAVNCALGEAPGRALLNVAANGDSSSFLPMLPTHMRAAPEACYSGTEEVEVVTMAALLEEHVPAGSSLFVKLDVQGFERQVLAASPIERLTGLELELSLVPLYDDSMLFLEAISLLGDHGFELCSTDAIFTDPTTGRLLQMDGVFFRRDDTAGPRASARAGSG